MNRVIGTWEKEGTVIKRPSVRLIVFLTTNNKTSPDKRKEDRKWRSGKPGNRFCPWNSDRQRTKLWLFEISFILFFILPYRWRNVFQIQSNFSGIVSHLNVVGGIRCERGRKENELENRRMGLGTLLIISKVNNCLFYYYSLRSKDFVTSINILRLPIEKKLMTNISSTLFEIKTRHLRDTERRRAFPTCLFSVNIVSIDYAFRNILISIGS